MNDATDQSQRAHATQGEEHAPGAEAAVEEAASPVAEEAGEGLRGRIALLHACTASRSAHRKMRVSQLQQGLAMPWHGQRRAGAQEGCNVWQEGICRDGRARTWKLGGCS